MPVRRLVVVHDNLADRNSGSNSLFVVLLGLGDLVLSQGVYWRQSCCTWRLWRQKEFWNCNVTLYFQDIWYDRLLLRGNWNKVNRKLLVPSMYDSIHFLMLWQSSSLSGIFAWRNAWTVADPNSSFSVLCLWAVFRLSSRDTWRFRPSFSPAFFSLCVLPFICFSQES